MPSKRRTQETTRIAVILPSRGLVYSKTVEELYEALEGLDFKIFWSHGRPIPDCFEIPTTEALNDPTFTHLLVIEEDMIIPKDGIKNMLKANIHAIAYDYPVSGDIGGTVLYDTKDTAYFTGCGILLVKMDVIRSMKKPIWRTDIAWNMKHRSSYVEFNIEDRQKADYGQQDIAFGLRLYINNMPIHVMKETTGQRKLEKRGDGMTNNGTHTIVEYTDVYKNQVDKQSEPNPFRKIVFKDGKIAELYYTSAYKFVESGDAAWVTIGNAEFNGIDKIKDWVYLYGR
jgi:hypothetical protein